MSPPKTFWHPTLKHYLSLPPNVFFYLNTFSENYCQLNPLNIFATLASKFLALYTQIIFCHPTFKNILLPYHQNILGYLTCQKFLPFHSKNYFVTLNNFGSQPNFFSPPPPAKIFCHPTFQKIFVTHPKIFLASTPKKTCHSTVK